MGEELRAFESEYASVKDVAESTKELKHIIAQQADKIVNLKQQSSDKDIEITRMKFDFAHLMDQNKVLKDESRDLQAAVLSSEQNAKKEKALREAESKLRNQAKEKLMEYLQAHKKIAEMYNGLDD
jgi:hypothetical protein